MGIYSHKSEKYVNKWQLTTERVNNSPGEQFQTEAYCYGYHIAKPQLIRWLR